MSSQPRCVALRLVVSCPCLKLCSHNCGVRVPACSVICPNTEKESSGADTWAQVLRHEREHLVVNASDKSGMRAPRHCQAHTGHSRHAAKYVRKQRLAVCARHTKNALTTRMAKSSSRNHKCVAGRLHLTIWWWTGSVLRFSWPVRVFVQQSEH